MQTQSARSARAATTEDRCASATRIVTWPAPGGPIEIVTIAGLVTTGSLKRVMARIAHAERRDKSVAAVTILTRAFLLMSAEDLVAAEMPHVGVGMLNNPRALVVPIANLPTFQRYGWLMAQQGLGRYVFSPDQMGPALQWARAMGQLMTAERVWKSLAASRRQTPSGE